MRYFRKVDEGYHAPDEDWGDPTYWLEVNEDGHADRQVEEYPNGKVLSYDRTHVEDNYGALGIMVIDGDEDWWLPYEITRADFEAKWQAHSPLNRRAEPGTAADRPRD